MNLQSFIRDIPDFPKKGIVFKDITTLLADKEAYSYLLNIIYNRYKEKNIDYIVGIESRGFIFGAALALQLNCGFIPIRKKGKLPYNVFSQTYQLEYGEDTLEIHVDALNNNKNVILLDDVLATGGTIEASIKLLNNFDINLVECLFIIEILALNGKSKVLENNQKHYSIIQS